MHFLMSRQISKFSIEASSTLSCITFPSSHQLIKLTIRIWNLISFIPLVHHFWPDNVTPKLKINSLALDITQEIMQFIMIFINRGACRGIVLGSHYRPNLVYIRNIISDFEVYHFSFFERIDHTILILTLSISHIFPTFPTLPRS